jgi:hypothetical protein
MLKKYFVTIFYIFKIYETYQTILKEIKLKLRKKYLTLKSLFINLFVC